MTTKCCVPLGSSVLQAQGERISLIDQVVPASETDVDASLTLYID